MNSVYIKILNATTIRILPRNRFAAVVSSIMSTVAPAAIDVYCKKYRNRRISRSTG
jgi:hypothetical protein